MLRNTQQNLDRFNPGDLGLWIGGILLLVFACLLPWLGSEPSYQGKRLSEWLRAGVEFEEFPDTAQSDLEARLSGNTNTSFGSRFEVRQSDPRLTAMRHIGTNAIPWLIRWLVAKPTKSEKLRVWLSEKLPPIIGDRIRPATLDPLDGSAASVHFEGFIGFAFLGTNGVVALPQLTELMHRTQDPFPLTWAMARLGPAGVGVLTNVLVTSTNASLPRSVLVALVQEGTNASAAIPVLVACLDPSRYDEFALDALARMGARHPDIVPKLTALMANPPSSGDFDQGTAALLLAWQRDEFLQ